VSIQVTICSIQGSPQSTGVAWVAPGDSGAQQACLVIWPSCSPALLLTAQVLQQTPREDAHLCLLLSPDVSGTAANLFPDAQQTAVKDFNTLPAAALRPQCLGIWID